MLRLLEALGYECRWVVDWSDHVWLEAWIGGRWVHVDPCEVSTCFLLFRSFFDCVGGGGGMRFIYLYVIAQTALFDQSSFNAARMDGACG